MRYSTISSICLTVSAILVAASVVLLFVPGPRLSVEFTGGTLMELKLPEGKTADDLSASLKGVTAAEKPLESETITRTKTDTYFLRIPTLSNEEHQALLEKLNKDMGQVTELQYTTIGPAVGSNLRKHAIQALLLASVAIIVYLAFAFRKMPGNLSPWSYGTCAVIALVHDVLLVVGVFTILSHVTTFQVDTLFVTALLSIMGHSVSDTIVIFDRARAILKEAGRSMEFEDAVILSLKQSFTRTVNMGVTLLIMLFALFILGSESIRWFILALIVGTLIGAYSSYFVATPLLIRWRNLRLARSK